jgi:hypothetical protein
MPANRSTAVMQRRIIAPDSLDYFPTPPWATRALCEWLNDAPESPVAACLADMDAWDPACGEMHMANPLGEYFGHVRATDIFRYTDDHGVWNFIGDSRPPFAPVDWIITNPPFIHAAEFICRALANANVGVAMLCRSTFAESETRWRDLWQYIRRRPAYELQFAERVVCLRDRLIRANAPDPFNLDANAVPRKASTATSYSWLVWMPRQHDWRKRIIPPCRTDLERDGDYPAYLDQWERVGRAPWPPN